MKFVLVRAAVAATLIGMLFSTDLRIVGEAAPEWDALFQRTEGWIGADGNYSVPLGNGRTLWLFSDTWIGEVKDGRRLDQRMINNSVGLQTGTSRPDLYFRTKPDGLPDSFIKPADGRGFFWLFGGVRTGAGLYLFLPQVEIVKPGSALGFQYVGSWLGHVANPDVPPLEWEIEQRRVPFSEFRGGGALGFYSAVLRDGGYIYVYGDDARDADGGRRETVLSRVPEERFGDFEAWRFLSDGEWQEDFTRSTSIGLSAGSESSVSFHPSLGRYVMVYTEGMTGRVMLRTATAPPGPWSEPVESFRAPEMDWPGSIFCYAGKAHQHLSGPDELLVTYAANSLVSAEVTNDARLYWPRFVRLKFTAPV